MINRIRVSELSEFDVVEHLENEESVAAYLDAVREENDPALWIVAIGDVTRARGRVGIADNRLDFLL